MKIERHMVDELRQQVAISDVAGAYVTWDARKSTPPKGDFWAPCPFHHEKTPSFHVDDQKGFYYCFGCHAKGDAITLLQEMEGLDFPGAIRHLATLAGVDLSPPERTIRRGRAALDDARTAGQAAHGNKVAMADNPYQPGDAARRAWAEGWNVAEQTSRAEHQWLTAVDGLRRAARIWREAVPDHPLLSEYLAARGVLVDPLRRAFDGALPPVLRLHEDLAFHDCDNAGHWREVHRGPAMIGLIAHPDFRCGKHSVNAGVHRTWITATGRVVVGGRKLPKKMIGATRYMDGVPIRFHTGRPARIVVGEGIETTLAVWSRLLADEQAGRKPPFGAECAISRGALVGGDDRRFRPGTRGRVGYLPDWSAARWSADDDVDAVHILAEGSAKDPETAERLYRMAERRHARRRDGSARQCVLHLPGKRWDVDVDYADLAKREVMGS